ncbi:hypothetical protein DM02DRAFT_251569 [Periconia macrospinosa]|uniref:Uncharacterized protein n=1 Tax=Periconia macrospinosa TaxID=97972 RepID=A0A2V1DYL4_9PLEO|nr:hypothetical protein DM02DRAFT_251569 [Periconia macrospinosa]
MLFLPVIDTHNDSDEGNQSNDSDSTSQHSIRPEISNDNDEADKESTSSEAEENNAPPPKPRTTRSSPPQFVSERVATATTTATTTATFPTSGFRTDEGDGYRFRVKYMCGSRINGCNAVFVLTNRDVMRCKECGGRIVLKMRTKKMVQFEAR